MRPLLTVGRLAPDKRYLETSITIENPTPSDVRFSHWTTALLAPGGGNQLTPRMEFVVPADRFIAAERPFNHWMRGLAGPVESSPLRIAEGWKDIGDLMATPLKEPYYAVYCRERGEAIVRQIDLDKTPGFNIWTWGYPPAPERQREYTAQPPNRGYAEFWNGTTRGFADVDLGTLQAGATLRWQERMFAISDITDASEVKRVAAGLQ